MSAAEETPVPTESPEESPEAPPAADNDDDAGSPPVLEPEEVDAPGADDGSDDSLGSEEDGVVDEEDDDEDDDDELRSEVADALELICDDVQNRYTGGALVIPDKLEGATILDLGCGSGLQSFVLSNLVGEKGRITGIDASEELLTVAKNNIQNQTNAYDYKEANVDFVLGSIENLSDAGLKEASFDVIVSNCAVSQASDKSAVLSGALSVLKEGGELYFSDVYANQPISDDLRQDKSLWKEGFGGALVWEELYSIAEKVGFSAPRLVSAKPYKAKNNHQRELLGDAQFVLATYRLFKLPETRQSATQATNDGSEDFVLDKNFVFKAGKAVTVSGDVSTILQSSRFSSAFSFEAPTKKPHTEEQVAHDNPFTLL